MKSELETQDIEAISQKIIEKLKPLLTDNGKSNGADDVIFTPQGLAEYLGVDVSWVYKSVSNRNIPYLKIGKYVRFRKKAIDKWLESKSTRPIPISR